MEICLWCSQRSKMLCNNVPVTRDNPHNSLFLFKLLCKEEIVPMKSTDSVFCQPATGTVSVEIYIVVIWVNQAAWGGAFKRFDCFTNQQESILTWVCTFEAATSWAVLAAISCEQAMSSSYLPFSPTTRSAESLTNTSKQTQTQAQFHYTIWYSGQVSYN